MANIGEISEIINGHELTLEVGSNRYILLENLQLHIGRTEERDAVDVGSLYTYGHGDNWFTATLKASTPELSSFNVLTQIDSDGNMSSTNWKIVAKDISGNTRTFAATGILREYDIQKANDGNKVSIDIFVRITGDTITVS